MSGLSMNIAAVNSLSKDLGNTNDKLARSFTDINTAMNTLGNSWTDKVGASYTAQFSKFISNASEINDMLKSIKKDIDNKVSRANQIYTQALNSMR